MRHHVADDVDVRPVGQGEVILDEHTSGSVDRGASLFGELRSEAARGNARRPDLAGRGNRVAVTLGILDRNAVFVEVDDCRTEVDQQ
ncbi:hypothetical protein P3H15_32990 [Rhodococcus sp. T2V]|nr:hypothetical protein [Rhodococcus sp. T2V]MDF3309836.1 hypothetical protein [Rhodococcus sp. T2V]